MGDEWNRPDKTFEVVFDTLHITADSEEEAQEKLEDMIANQQIKPRLIELEEDNRGHGDHAQDWRV